MKKFVLAAIAGLLLSAPAAAEPLKIRVDWSATPAQSAPIMPVALKYEPGLYRHWGKSYVVEPLYLAGGGGGLTALAASETDISAFTPQALALAVTEAKLDLRIIGQQVSTEVPGYAGTSFWVRKAEIARIEDLKGKTIGVNARGNTPDAVLRITMGRHAMQDGKDYQIVEMRYPALLPALESKRVDAAVLILPFSVLAAKNPELKPLFGLGEVMGPTETVMYVARSDFLAKNRAAVVDFLEDNMRLRRFLFDPAKRPEVLKLVAEVTKQPAENFTEWVYTTKDYYVDPHAMLNAERLQKNIEKMHETGITKATFQAAPYVDLSLAREAAARLAR
jgi:NitT/TauT family transport system substrate-binding protein